MLNPNGQSIYSAGLTKLADLIYDIVVVRTPKGKPVSKLWDTAYKATLIIDSLDTVSYLEDEEANSLYDCLIALLEIDATSSYPLPTQQEIILNQGSQGQTGNQGNDGEDGQDGQNGISITFLGSFSSPPPSPSLNQCYRDTALKGSYLWDGTVWQLMVEDGANGINGTNGSNGTNGLPGTDGNTILSGTVDPTTEGVNGDFYINTITWQIFGPKTSGSWSVGTDIIGEDGADGTNGIDGVDGANGIDGATGDPGLSAFVYIAYADDITGTNYILVQSNDITSTLSAFDSNKEFIAVLLTSTAIGSIITVSDFTNKWARYAGDGDRWTTSSTTSQTIAGSGLLTFQVETGLAWSVGQTMVVADFADFTNRMEGFCSSYNPATGQIVLSIVNDFGSGTFSNWAISLQPFTVDPPTTYGGASPSTITVNDLPSGSVILGLTYDELFEHIFAPFVNPTFSSFAFSGVSLTQENGATITTPVTATWGTTTSINVATNSIDILDITGSATLESNIANDGSEAGVILGVVTRTTPGTYVWRISGDYASPGVGSFTRDLTITWYWRLYYGTSASVTLNEAAIEALASSTLVGTPVATYSFSASNYKYFTWADSLGSPVASTGFRDTSTNLAVAMADSTDNAAYSNTQNGWSYALVSVTNTNGQTTNYRVYRTKFTLAGSINIQVS